MANRTLMTALLVLATPHVGSTHAAGICDDALRAARNSVATYAEERPFPIQCNWNYMFALEDKMIKLGDLTNRRSSKHFHDQIDADAIRRAQRRVALPQTGIVDEALFIAYMSLS
jgi:hypothetical protein